MKTKVTFGISFPNPDLLTQAKTKSAAYGLSLLAQTRPMTEDEKEEMDGSWVIDPTTEEKIMPNVAVSHAPATSRKPQP